VAGGGRVQEQRLVAMHAQDKPMAGGPGRRPHPVGRGDAVGRRRWSVSGSALGGAGGR
jgi:hypothetical protein